MGFSRRYSSTCCSMGWMDAAEVEDAAADCRAEEDAGPADGPIRSNTEILLATEQDACAVGWLGWCCTEDGCL